jgi:hypothetical protein
VFAALAAFFALVASAGAAAPATEAVDDEELVRVRVVRLVRFPVDNSTSPASSLVSLDDGETEDFDPPRELDRLTDRPRAMPVTNKKPFVVQKVEIGKISVLLIEP